MLLAGKYQRRGHYRRKMITARSLGLPALIAAKAQEGKTVTIKGMPGRILPKVWPQAFFLRERAATIKNLS